MATDVLAAPVWQALTGPQRELALPAPGAATYDAPLALRYPPEVSPFGALADLDDPQAWEQLAALTEPGDSVALWTAPDARPSRTPAGWSLTTEIDALQLVAPPGPMAGPVAAEVSGPDLVELSLDDAEEMLALAELTKPGPFGIGTPRFGGYVGVRHEGRLVAMAGRRMHPPGWVEISGVCTHPDARGHGLAGRLVGTVADRIRADGDDAFLHVMRANTGAIRLYEAMGFRTRGELVVSVVERVARVGD